MVDQVGESLAAILALFFILIAPFIQPPWILSVLILVFSLTLFLIKKTRYLAYALVPIAILYAFGLLPLLVFCCTIAIVVIGNLSFLWGKDILQSYLVYIVAALAGCTLVMVYLSDYVPLVILFGVVIAVLLKAIVHEREDALMIEALGIAMTMSLIYDLNYQADMILIAAAVLIAFSFGYFSYRTGTADVSGLFSGALIGIILIVFADIRWFMVMLGFFVAGSVSTRYRFAEKERMGVEQPKGGARGYLNVFSNGAIGAAAAILWGVYPHPLFAALFVGSVATAAADTMASEIGVTGGIPYMITNLSRVPVGTNGGVTVLGEAVAVVGSVFIAIIACILGVIPVPFIPACVIAGFAGTNIDSYIGALIENRGIFGNAGTNFVATTGGGIVAVLLAFLAL